MAIEMKPVRVDDLDGTEGAQTVQFNHEGTLYEIDLNDQNVIGLEQTRAEMKRYVDAGRVVTETERRPAAPVSGPPGSNGAPEASNEEIREWARKKGYDIGERGRIPQDIRDAFEKAQVRRKAPVATFQG